MRVLSQSLLDELAGKASTSARGRTHFNIHASAADLVQRYIVVADRRSYFRPHRHLTRSELALVLRGGFEVLTFSDDGLLSARYSVGPGLGDLGFELPRATWHTLLATADGSAFLEVKEGPYDPSTAVEFAPWAPEEGAAEVPQFMQRLLEATAGMPCRKHP
ncbi:MAG TPA: WbuC family cupin fold metalloprotein [Steroidobacteraceae bacterium]|nr:WbuC family cupin fold metalloprotein [Steroidobacteraceae bacterium]